MSKFAKRSPFGTSQRIAYGISSGRSSGTPASGCPGPGVERSLASATLNIANHSKEDGRSGLGFPLMDRLDGISAPELRAALLYVRGSPGPVTADDAAVALDVHRGVARGRLERLLQTGLLQAEFSRRSGRNGPGAGRPAKLYSASPEPDALEIPPRRFPALVSRLLDEFFHHRLEQIPGDGRIALDQGPEVARRQDVAAKVGRRGHRCRALAALQ